jgi:hypothetical protein
MEVTERVRYLEQEKGKLETNFKEMQQNIAVMHRDKS